MTTDNYLSNEKRLHFLEDERHNLKVDLDKAVSPQDMMKASHALYVWDDEHWHELARCMRIDAQFDALEMQL